MSVLLENVTILFTTVVLVFLAFIVVAVLFRVVSKIVFRTFFSEKRRGYGQNDEGGKKSAATKKDQARG